MRGIWEFLGNEADSISEVNILGVKLLKRFLTIAIFITLTVMLVAFFVASAAYGVAYRLLEVTEAVRRSGNAAANEEKEPFAEKSSK